MRGAIRTIDESPIVSQRLPTLPEAAHYLGCTLWSVRELIWKRRIPYKRFGKRFQVDRKDLDDLVDREKRSEGMGRCRR
jgi:excisionase family DNA binding protein